MERDRRPAFQTNCLHVYALRRPDKNTDNQKANLNNQTIETSKQMV